MHETGPPILTYPARTSKRPRHRLGCEGTMTSATHFSDAAARRRACRSQKQQARLDQRMRLVSALASAHIAQVPRRTGGSASPHHHTTFCARHLFRLRRIGRTRTGIGRVGSGNRHDQKTECECGNTDVEALAPLHRGGRIQAVQAGFLIDRCEAKRRGLIATFARGISANLDGSGAYMTYRPVGPGSHGKHPPERPGQYQSRKHRCHQRHDEPIAHPRARIPFGKPRRKKRSTLQTKENERGEQQ